MESYTSAIVKKYGAEPLSQLDFDPKAWIKPIGRLMSTWTNINRFGTRVLSLRLLATTMTSKSACGPNDASPPMSTPVPERKGYQQLLSNVTTLMTGLTDIKGLLMDVIGSRRSQPQPDEFGPLQPPP
ncbi:Uncharacterized protein TCM_002792 [Theobroma cacao]|uniref:Uncharacterized protein n=1 Tax=Theobroma cacao TaxID=3641 RepID=A0A061DP21_THECC|nr:Uncharacterized protein TCM_002792 [Theobroma cacao]